MIAVTGLGAVTALGQSATETWARLQRGERGFRELSLFSTEGYRVRVVAEVPSLPSLGDDGRDARGDASRTSELGLLAAREAIADAGFGGAPEGAGTSLAGATTRSAPPPAWGDRRVGLVMGGSTAGMLETESVLAVLVGPEGAVDPAARQEALRRMLRHPLSAPTDRLARELGPFRRVRSLSSACSSGANAFIVAAAWLELGLVDVVLCGAADALCRVTMSGFHSLGALDPNGGARPFDRRRQGLTLGEGAGFVVLERADEARARGARIWCTLLGWGSVSEAHHITNPEPSGAMPVRAIHAALARAGLAPSDIDYVNAHGTGTRLNDPMETRALASVFGPELPRVPVSSSKGQIGHTLGAAGAIEAVITALAIAHDVVPPTGGLEEPDEACALRHVLSAEARPVRAALSSSFGFGGMDAVLVFGKPDAVAPRDATVPRAVVVTSVATVTPGACLVNADVASLPDRAPVSASVAAETFAALDPVRARRLDRAGKLASVAGALALGTDGDKDVGMVLGSAFGAVDASASFLRRLAEKGPRFVSPADFPNLVPSAPAGSASIYLGLTGPSMVVADLATSGECAVVQAFELVAHGEASRALAVAVEERSTIVEQVLSVLFGGDGAADASGEPSEVLRREGSAAIALASAAVARERGLDVLAEVVVAESWRADAAPLASLPAPPEGAVVVLGGASLRAAEWLDRTAWAACPRVTCEAHAGTHEAVGGIAVAVAAAMIGRGQAPSVLCVGSARGSGYAVLLRRWGP